MGAAEFSAARTARDAVFVTTSKLGGGFPRPIVGHRTFDREDATVVVSDDQEERLDRVGVIAMNMPSLLPRLFIMITSVTALSKPKPLVFLGKPARTMGGRSQRVWRRRRRRRLALRRVLHRQHPQSTHASGLLLAYDFGQFSRVARIRSSPLAMPKFSRLLISSLARPVTAAICPREMSVRAPMGMRPFCASRSNSPR
jgi:hypothetical protein